jgi:hypothetical protein
MPLRKRRPNHFGNYVLRRFRSEKVAESDNLDALLSAAVELGGAGPFGNRVTFTPALSEPEVCSSLALIRVPLGGSNGDRKGKTILKLGAEASPALGKNSGTKDKDKMKIFCLPSNRRRRLTGRAWRP